MSDATFEALAALVVNAILCIFFAEAADTFIISSAILCAAFILTLR